jgi:glutamate-ammonia-ligase adenylyltransferase
VILHSMQDDMADSVPDFTHNIATAASTAHNPSIWPDHSVFAQRWLNRFADWQSPLLPDLPLLQAVSAFLEDLDDTGDEASLKKNLRLKRQRIMLEVMRRDLLGLASLQDVTQALSLLADRCIDVAARFAHRQLAARYGEPADCDALMVLGMGKLGGRELNVSSDVDLIFVYASESETLGAAGTIGKRISHSEFFTQVGRRIMNLISDATEDGFVFRVDMRLRPNGDSGPLAVSLDMLEEYFFVQGREWERYAWIKARVVNQAPAPAQAPAFANACDALDRIRRPFVFRKYLDFGAIRALRDLHQQIRQEVRRREKGEDAGGIHVKLGRGGIREIEFMAQVFQLIRGGREKDLQIRPTLDVLQLCCNKGLISAQTLERLQQAYDFWRRLEHRLQYVEDAQTHWLPPDETVRSKMALAMGLPDAAALQTQIAHWQNFVDAQFQEVFGDKQEDEHETVTVDDWPEQWAEAFGKPEQARARWQDLLNSSRYRSLPATHRERVDRLLPALLQDCSQTPNADAAWARSMDLLDSIARRGAYLSLLDEFPAARARVVKLLSSSAWTSAYLRSHPILLDELLDERNLYAPPDWAAYETDLRNALDHARLPDGKPDLEQQMNVSREMHHTHLFRLLVQDLQSYWTVEQLADHLSALADRTLAAIMDAVWQQVPGRHREKPRFAIIAYGKLGGKELGYASDLDLIFLFDDEHESAPELYSKLAQRLNRWLTTQTSAGILFETDYRLRPNGDAGLLVSSMDAFERYQRREGGVGAWVWEHQALTRARYCVGDTQLGVRFEDIRTQTLRTRRNIAELTAQVVDMRARMHEGHPNPTNLFDLKHSEGGMVDIEFIVQFLVLAHSADHAELTANAGNIALLKRAGELGLIDSALAAKVADAYRRFRARQHALRLAGLDVSRVEPDEFEKDIAAVKALWTSTLVSAVPPPATCAAG